MKKNCKIHLVVQYYRVQTSDIAYNQKRQCEVDECLLKNAQLDEIDCIHLLTEKHYDLPLTPALSEKIVQTVIGERLTYEDAFNYYNEHLLGEICFLSNADIIFTSSIKYTKSLNLTNTFLALTRYEDVLPQNREEKQPYVVYGKDCDLSINNPWLQKNETAIFSQDAWAWRSDTPIKVINSHFRLGATACDNIISRRFIESGYNVINPCNYIAILHKDMLSHLGTASSYTAKGEVSKKREIPVGKFSEFIFLHPAYDVPEFETVDKKETMYNESPIDSKIHNNRKQIYSTRYESSLIPIVLNSSQVDIAKNLFISKPSSFPETSEQFINGVGSFTVSRRTYSVTISVHFARLTTLGTIDFVSEASQICVDASQSYLRPKEENESSWKHIYDHFPPWEYQNCSNLVYRSKCNEEKCMGVRFRFFGNFTPSSKIKFFIRSPSHTIPAYFIRQQKVDFMLFFSIYLAYGKVMEDIDVSDFLDQITSCKRIWSTLPSVDWEKWYCQKEHLDFYHTIENGINFISDYLRLPPAIAMSSNMNYRVSSVVNDDVLHCNINGVPRKEGISILISIMNRTSNLLQYMASWMIQKVDEIVIVDWSTSEGEIPVEEAVLSMIKKSSVTQPKIVLIRVNGEKDYYRTAAQNLGACFVSYDKIMKLDSDVTLRDQFFENHILEKDSFYVGDWKMARDDNEKFTHGNVYFHTSDFFKINGYDERIQSYGWDDSDFSRRLDIKGLSKRYFNIDMMYHNPHSNELRKCNLRDSETLPNDPEVLTQKHRYLLRVMSKWSHVYRRKRYKIDMIRDDENIEIYECERDSSIPEYKFPTFLHHEAEQKAIQVVSGWRGL